MFSWVNEAICMLFEVSPIVVIIHLARGVQNCTGQPICYVRSQFALLTMEVLKRTSYRCLSINGIRISENDKFGTVSCVYSVFILYES